MGDAVNVNALPAGLDLYAGYVDGATTTGNFQALARRFPTARLVRITTTGILDAEVADMEAGDLRPSQARAWAAAKLQDGQTPTIYCSADVWDEMRALCADLPGVQWWVANYNAQPSVPPGAVAHQYQSTSYDISAVADFWPGVDQEGEVITFWSDGTRLGAYSPAAGMRHLTPWEEHQLRTVPALRAQVANPDQPWTIAASDFDDALTWARRTS